MSGRFSTRPQNIGAQNTLSVIANLCFSFFLIGVFVFTVIAVTYEPKNGALVVHAGEDSVVRGVESAVLVELGSVESGECRVDDPIECTDPNVFHLLMRAAMERFRDVRFYRFGKAVRGSNGSFCDMAWRFRHKEADSAAFHTDYRSFEVVKYENCTFNVVGIGEYRSGLNARKGRVEDERSNIALPEVVGGMGSEGLPEVELEGLFSEGKYLIYSGGGERCKSMDAYMWSFMCMLGEAEYLNRTLVLDLSVCLSKMYTSSGQDEEGKDFRFYYDLERLKDASSVMDQGRFWSKWNERQQKDGLSLHVVEDIKVTPMELAVVKDALIMRKFGSVEPHSPWHRVCEGEAGPVIRRPWGKVYRSRQLLDVASAIATRMNWDFDAVHVERGEKAKNKEVWPNLDRDTSPEALLTSLQYKIEDRRDLYVATDEPGTSFFDPLKEKFSLHVLDDYKDLWDVNSNWYFETLRLNNGNPVEFDGFMRLAVDSEVLLRAKRHVETFNDLTEDCKDGINTCKSTS